MELNYELITITRHLLHSIFMYHRLGSNSGIHIIVNCEFAALMNTQCSGGYKFWDSIYFTVSTILQSMWIIFC